MPASSGALRTAVLDAIADRLSALAELLVDEGSADRQVFITLQDLEARARRLPWPACRRFLTDPTPLAEQMAGVARATPDAAARTPWHGRRGMGASRAPLPIPRKTPPKNAAVQQSAWPGLAEHSAAGRASGMHATGMRCNSWRTACMGCCALTCGVLASLELPTRVTGRRTADLPEAEALDKAAFAFAEPTRRSRAPAQPVPVHPLPIQAWSRVRVGMCCSLSGGGVGDHKSQATT
ncbi:hypothetical protein ACVB8X_02270 [Streptomyces sp. NRAIS4]